ncbi:C-type lectin domain-containing protein [candidate division KSB1 bacterium]|nr:C-type lectin domain-containing protein [candidate division KSB1 bacterium]
MRRVILLLGALVALTLVACDWNNHTEPELTVDNAAILGGAIFINVDQVKPNGIAELVVNEGDTAVLNMSTALLRDPNYTFTSGDAGVITVVKDPNDNKVAYVIAQADSGGSTTLHIVDNANSGAKRTITVRIDKQWADPDFFINIGRFEGHTYYLSRFERGWAEAEIHCRESGGYLVAIRTIEENAFLHAARGRIENAWIGIRLNNVNGAFKITTWANGEPVEYKAFTSTDAGIFMEIFYHLDPNGNWENWHERTFPYLLEME